MRIALFGGTFDPPHRGHIAIAKAAADAFKLDQVLFAPTGMQPLKGDHATPFATRMELVKAACESDPRFIPSAIDAPHPDGHPNYTVDTLAALDASHPGDQLFNIVGADSFLNVRHWRDSDKLFNLADWIVVSRPGYPVDTTTLAPLRLSPEQRQRIHLLGGVAEDISATELRERLSSGDSCNDLLSLPVAEILAENHLYRPPQKK